MSVKEDIKKIGDNGDDALLKELNQLHEQQVLLLKKKEDMSYEERKMALRYRMFLKEKTRQKHQSQRMCGREIAKRLYYRSGDKLIGKI